MSAPFVREVHARCTATRAFDVFTAQIDLWWPRTHRREAYPNLRMEQGVGGRILAFSEEDSAAPPWTMGRITRWAPPHTLAYDWFPGAPVGASHVVITFTERASGAGEVHTLVRVVHTPGTSDAETWPRRVARFAASWEEVLIPYIQLAGAAQTGDAR